MGEVPNESGQTGQTTKARMFWIGSCLMLPWPILGGILSKSELPIVYVHHFIGAYVLLFLEPLEAIERWTRDLPDIWEPIIMWTLVALMVAMWAVMWFLPFFGLWRRHPGVLYFAQFSYALAQAICGGFFVAKHF